MFEINLNVIYEFWLRPIIKFFRIVYCLTIVCVAVVIFYLTLWIVTVLCYVIHFYMHAEDLKVVKSGWDAMKLPMRGNKS